MPDFNRKLSEAMLQEAEANLNRYVEDAYRLAATDPAACLNTIRKIAELICTCTLSRYDIHKDGNEIKELDKMRIQLGNYPQAMPRIYVMHVETIQNWGNFGSHNNRENPSSGDIFSAFIAMERLTAWFRRENGLSPIAVPDFTKASAFPAQTVSSPSILGVSRINPHLDTVAFFDEIISDPSRVKEICMAFHAGAEWRRESEKVALLKFIEKHRIPMRVMLNNSNSVRNICPHMHQEGREYVSFAKAIREWRKMESNSNGLVQVRVSEIPMLHRTYIIQNKDATGAANIKYYTYGNDIPANDHRAHFVSGSHEYAMYANEFDYLWEHAQGLCP